MQREVSTYYQFLGLHNFLIGLFPFFLPVFLYTKGFGLADISFFVGVTGLSFSLTLYIFDHCKIKSLALPIIVSFVSEIVFLLLLVLDAPWITIAVANGIYSCLYWTIQRMFFLAGTSEFNSGRRFGNFQIYVLVVLKIGIFCGSVLLEQFGVKMILTLSLVAIVFGGWFMIPGLKRLEGYAVTDKKPLRVTDLFRFSDSLHSRLVFVIDGVFLYLESYFWVISLFLFTGESFIRLGGVVIVLALVLGMTFYVLKNKIDSLDDQLLFRTGVLCYVLSWVFRGYFDISASTGSIPELGAILIIAFATAFFRLTFNKRFFDNARRSSGTSYLFIKSYYSQFIIGIFFLTLGSGTGVIDNAALLGKIYFGAAAVSFLYLFYRPAINTKI